MVRALVVWLRARQRNLMLTRNCSWVPILPRICLVTRVLWLLSLILLRNVVYLVTGSVVTLVTPWLLTAIVRSSGPR